MYLANLKTQVAIIGGGAGGFGSDGGSIPGPTSIGGSGVVIIRYQFQ